MRPAETLGEREHEVEPLADDEALGELLAVADADHLVAEPFERAGDAIDGLDRVELGRLLFRIAHRAVVIAQVIDETDLHLGW